MPAVDLIELMRVYALRGVSDWRSAPDELRRRALTCLLNRIADTDAEASMSVNAIYGQAAASLHKFIPMPALGAKGIERSFFLPIRETKEDGRIIISFDLFLLVANKDCLAFRFEPAGLPDSRHQYPHVQFCTKLIQRTMESNNLLKWIPDSYPAFPVRASNPVNLFFAMATSIHGYHGGLLSLLQDIFEGRPAAAREYAQELEAMLRA